MKKLFNEEQLSSFLKDFIYERRTFVRGLITKLRGYKISFFKILIGYDDVDIDVFFRMKAGSITGVLIQGTVKCGYEKELILREDNK